MPADALQAFLADAGCSDLAPLFRSPPATWALRCGGRAETSARCRVLARLRQYFPNGTDLSRWGIDELQAVAFTLNDRPRKTLAEALNEHLLSLQEAGVATTG